MNDRERILTLLAGGKPDMTPWIPRLEIWYRAQTMAGTLPERYRGMSLREVERALGCGTPARGGRIAEKTYEGVEIDVKREGAYKVTEYRTPVGTVREVMQFSEELTRQGLPGHVIEYPLKTRDDYAVWTYVLEHTRWTPDFDRYVEYDREIGGDGLPMTAIGDVPFHAFARELAGYEHAFYHLADMPDAVEGLLETMEDVFAQRWLPIIRDSPARLLLHGGHLSSQFTPPALFEQYILPYCREFFPRLHEAGKYLVMHADNDTTAILDLLVEGGWDMLECFATAPLVRLELRRALDVFDGRLVVWGGVPSSILGPACSAGEFAEHLESIATVAETRDAFILGVSDNVMPFDDIERVEAISRRLGRTPG